MKLRFISVLVGLLLPFIVSAAGHAQKWVGHGFSNAISVKQTVGKGGVIIHQETQEFWDWSNAPEAFPRAVAPSCSVSVAMDSTGNFLGAMTSCEIVDSDGDVVLFRGKAGPNGEGTWEQVTGSGKYANYEASGTFRTTVQISDTQSKFEFEGETIKK